MESVTHFLQYSPYIGLLGFIFAVSTYYWVIRQSAGNSEMVRIAELIESGAMAFLKKEYTFLIVFLAAVTMILGFNSQLGWNHAMCYVIGALASMGCGFIGMKAATKANVRTAQAASSQGGQASALSVAFYGGSVMGMAVASVGLMGLALLYQWLSGSSTIGALNGFAMGASSIALFARVGGGIYTKAADVGADLVGKVEAGIPEDDPRNPATIADNVGDNVGDTAGMGADIFESYVGSVVATIFLGWRLHGGSGAEYLPLVVITVGLVASVISINLMSVLKKIDPAWALRLAPIIALGGLFAGTWFAVDAMNFREFSHPMGPFYAMVLGSLVGLFIGLVTEYFTAGRVLSSEKGGTCRTDRSSNQYYSRIGGGNVLLHTAHFAYMCRHLWSGYICRLVWNWYRCCRYVGDSGSDYDGRCIWPHFGQCGRNCGNVQTWARGEGHYRWTRFHRQYDGCHWQRLCHWIGCTDGFGHVFSIFCHSGNFCYRYQRTSCCYRIVHRRMFALLCGSQYHEFCGEGGSGNGRGSASSISHH